MMRKTIAFIRAVGAGWWHVYKQPTPAASIHELKIMLLGDDSERNTTGTGETGAVKEEQTETTNSPTITTDTENTTAASGETNGDETIDRDVDSNQGDST